VSPKCRGRSRIIWHIPSNNGPDFSRGRLGKRIRALLGPFGPNQVSPRLQRISRCPKCI
jgi:hypothetical protein